MLSYPYFCPDIVMFFFAMAHRPEALMLVDPMDNCGQQGIPVSFSTDGCHDSGRCASVIAGHLSLGFFIEVNGLFSRFFQCQLTNHWRVSYSYWADSYCVSSLGVKAILETGCQFLWRSFCRVHNGWLMDYFAKFGASFAAPRSKFFTESNDRLGFSGG